MEQASAAGSFADLTVAQFVERLSSGEPVPGGGSASAVAASLGAALISMVAALSTGKPKYAAHEATLARCGVVGKELAAEFMKLADRDAEAYAGYSAALKLPRETELQQSFRRQAIQAAACAASDTPWECVKACARLVVAAEALAGRSNVNAASDVLVAALLGEAAARGAAENVLINLSSTGDVDYSETMRQQVASALREIAAVTARTREIVLSGQAQEPEQV
ncbi:MAG TPA: cyclodeaminase/cyclohydrolase family protein [Candidatus Limnocylindrales bacterium]